MARMAGLKVIDRPVHDPALYHASAVLVAGGAVALIEEASRLLEQAGLQRDEAERALCSLMSSALDNMQEFGTASALTGPVRRGSVETVERHRRALASQDKRTHRLYDVLSEVQLELAKTLGEAPVESFDEIGQVIENPEK